MCYKKITYALVIVAWLFSILSFAYMPDVMVSHWDSFGNANGSMPKILGVLMMPILSVLLLLLLKFLPRMDPLYKNIQTFKEDFERFIASLMGFLLFVYILTLIWNLGVRFNLVRFLAVDFAFLLYELSVLLPKTKRNYTIGIRTPWTLADDRVWQKTHVLGEKVFRILAVLSLFGMLFPHNLLWFLAPMIIAVLFLFFYGCFIFKR